MRLVVVGSGASGVHFALSALEAGHEVTLLDVGHERPPLPEPEATFSELKERLADPAGYFLGPGGEGVVYPSTKPSYYGHPPSKQYVFDTASRVRTRGEAMQPLFSFAKGGLAEAWTAGSYPFNDRDLQSFPVGYEELRPFYALVARRIGIGAATDDLERFIPLDPAAGYLPPLPPDPHSAWLLERYQARRNDLQRSLGFYLGRSRVATLSQPLGGRDGCSQCGRCLWGCPTEALYRPSVTLRACQDYPGFRYLPGALVTALAYDAGGTVRAAMIEPLAPGVPTELTGDAFVLAAGALLTSKLVLDSVFRQTGRVARLSGLMDNRQVHVPFLSLARIGQPAPTDLYQFHHLAFGLETSDPAAYVHGQITTLKAASVHAIIQSLPLDLRGSLAVFRALRAGLGIANVNLHDVRRPESWMSIRPESEGQTELDLNYTDPPDEADRQVDALRRTRRALWQLGCVVPPGMSRVLPKGASAHYSGTLPMAPGGDFTCSEDGRLRGFTNLIVADGATFPFLPAKNLTFTLMANGARLAQCLGATVITTKGR